MNDIKIQLPFIERLRVEREDLDKKREKLSAFILSEKFEEIDPFQMSLLSIQLLAMDTYSQCLLERDMWLTAEEEDNKDETK